VWKLRLLLRFSCEPLPELNSARPGIVRTDDVLIVHFLDQNLPRARSSLPRSGRGAIVELAAFDDHRTLARGIPAKRSMAVERDGLASPPGSKRPVRECGRGAFAGVIVESVLTAA
jgi:hypothetical protein